MNHTTLQSILQQAQARLTADRTGVLADTGMPAGLAYLVLPLLQELAATDDIGDVSDLLGRLVEKQHRRTLLAALANPQEALRTLAEQTPLHAACQALLAALSDAPAAQDAAARQAMQASDGGQIHHATQQTIYGDYHAAPPDPNLPRQERALLTYLDSMGHLCNALALGPLDPTDAAHRRPLELARVYIGLHTTTQVELTEDEQAARPEQPGQRGERETRPLTALEALAHIGQRRLLLLGAPGSGKSTFVNHLALCLAGAALCARRTDAFSPEGGWLAQVPGWTLGDLLPIRLVLRDFAAFTPLARATQGSVALLRDFLQAVLEADDCADALEPLTTALSDGQAILLLDGLDEVVGTPVLNRVAESIQATARAYPRSPILVTCRILDYQAERLRQLAGFPTQTLADLSDAQIDQFVQNWYCELALSGRRANQQAQEDAQALQQAIAARPELRELARLPLLLTVMALVHTNRGSLPDARALLYDDCIDILLLRWRQQRGAQDLLTRLELPQFRSSDLLALMARLGFAAHELAERHTDTNNRPADLSESAVMQVLAEGFAPYDAARKHALAEQVLHALTQGNGLLLQRGPAVYAFPHRTFQEFLAGYHLLRQPNAQTLCLERAPQAHWHEALLLMAGYQVLAGGEFDKPLGLVEKLLARSPGEQVLAGDLLILMGRERLTNYDPTLLQPGGLWRRVYRALLKLAVQGQAPSVPAALRVRAGLLMGRMCVYETTATAAPIVDPRLPLAVIGLPSQHTPGWRHSLAAYWCPVAAGPFWYGDDQTDSPLQQIVLPYTFTIARYPTTNADFARFVAAGGYTDERWWTTQGWQWLTRTDKTAVDWLSGNSRYNNPVQPVVTVTWYEAVAYCAWLTAEGHAQGWLPETDEIRLPTSLEWERAARHTDQRRYPWGDAEPDSERANYDDTGIGAPSPVGCFPGGRAACGALDMAGNVLEWLATPDEKKQQVEPEKDFTRGTVVLLSGSAFWREIEYLCCGSRGWDGPIGWSNGLGFRVVWSLRSSKQNV